MPDFYHSLKTMSDAFEMPERADAPLDIEDKYLSYGFIGSRFKPQLKQSPVAVMQRMGGGEAILFVDNPLFRGFWEQGKVLITNALLF
jgi:hypothetical protein